jgi:hypothetical protein
VLMHDTRQVGHDEEEEDDEASRHAEAGYPDPQFSSKRVVFSRGRFLFHGFLSGESEYRTLLNAGCKEPCCKARLARDGLMLVRERRQSLNPWIRTSRSSSLPV